MAKLLACSTPLRDLGIPLAHRAISLVEKTIEEMPEGPRRTTAEGGPHETTPRTVTSAAWRDEPQDLRGLWSEAPYKHPHQTSLSASTHHWHRQ